MKLHYLLQNSKIVKINILIIEWINESSVIIKFDKNLLKTNNSVFLKFNIYIKNICIKIFNLLKL